ncbi:MAG: LemA family protein [Patescibacteria group bacterium]|jgi:LemA protein
MTDGVEKKIMGGCGIVGVLFVLFLIIVIGSFIGVWNTLNTKYQDASEGKSLYSSALNNCTPKIEGVWTIYSQYLDHESQTFQNVAEARSGYKKAFEAYMQAKKEGKNTAELTKLGGQAVNAALAFNVQIEANPNLKAAEVAQSNISNMQEAINEIKTALDDWIGNIKGYNTYRGSAWPSIAGAFMSKYPSELPYYEGPVKELDIKKLNPRK